MSLPDVVILVLILAPPVLLVVGLTISLKGIKLDLNSPVNFFLVSFFLGGDRN